jgi:hypothetical protein
MNNVWQGLNMIINKSSLTRYDSLYVLSDISVANRCTVARASSWLHSSGLIDYHELVGSYLE